MITKTLRNAHFALLLCTAFTAFACRKPASDHAPAAPAAPTASANEATVAPGQTLTVHVDGSGYHPARVMATAGSDITLSFVRTTDESCGQELKIPSQNQTYTLPLNQPVRVALQVPASGELGFTCGMDMYRGAVVVR
ncbi:MAG: cupredoxin domain-containing protein [Deltaproteobacteria bacterium]|nr:cupredoxin domain-containing protein [Deltaproteobacteria bacterium]